MAQFMTHVDLAALKPAITGMKSDPVKGPVLLAATVRPAWSCLRVTALNLHPAPGDNTQDSYKSRGLREIQTHGGKENWACNFANRTVQYSDTERERHTPSAGRLTTSSLWLLCGDPGSHCSLYVDFS